MTDLTSVLQQLAHAHAEHDLSEPLSRSIVALKSWAERLEKRQQLLLEKKQDFEGLLSYTEQLSLELDKSKPQSSVALSRQESLRKAVSKLSKTLRDMTDTSTALEEELAPTERLENALLSVEERREQSVQLYAHYRDVLRSTELSTSSEKRERKRSDREKRSSSPKRLAA